MYHRIIADLRRSYDRNAPEREGFEITPWKVDERQTFLTLLHHEGKQRLLEIGAGPGRDSKFFQDNGLDVTCTDLSPEMVALCRAKGLTAYAMDFLSLDFPPASFDAVYALNCLLHVPNNDFPRVLEAIHTLMRPGGLFFLGVYGGVDSEGIPPEDTCSPKRFFSLRTDEQLQTFVSAFFKIHTFHVVPLENDIHHFQSLILRRE